MSQSLYAYNNPQYDEAQALRWQAAQVSAISLNLSRMFSRLRSVTMMCRLAVCKAGIAMWMLSISPLVRRSFLSFLAFGPGIEIAGRLRIEVISQREHMFELHSSRTRERVHNTVYVQ